MAALFLRIFRGSRTPRGSRTAREEERTLIARARSFKTPCMYMRARASIEQREAPIHEGARERAHAHKRPIRSAQNTRTCTHVHDAMRRDDKERALATSNAATASACAPLYVSQGRHVRLRTTYLYLCRFVHARPRPRTFPSAEIGRRVESRRFTDRPNPSSFPRRSASRAAPRPSALPLPDRFNPFNCLAIVMTNVRFSRVFVRVQTTKFTLSRGLRYDFK